jgi:hypothetical protein
VKLAEAYKDREAISKKNAAMIQEIRYCNNINSGKHIYIMEHC